MFFTKDTEMLIDFFLNEKKNFGDTIKNRTHKRKYSQLLSKLYYDIKEADLYMVKKKMDACFHKKIKKINTISDIPKPSVYDSKFFPSHISKEINIKSTFLLEYKCTIHNRNIHLHMILFDDIDVLKDETLLETYDKYAYSVYILLSLLHSYSNKKCGKNLHIYIYYTDFKKYLPEKTLDIIGPTHVNTGLTNTCHVNNIDNEIIIFRKEEWFKVLIHECFHHLNIDFSTMDLTKTHKEMHKIFPISSEFNIFEAYTEIWSKILNVCFVSYNMINHSRNKKEFVNYSIFLIELESAFSQIQCVKVLKFMTLSYENLYNNEVNAVYLRKYLYKENTNVFSYYILSACLFSQPLLFLEWCDVNNLSFMKFKQTEKNLDHFLTFIKERYNQEDFLLKLRDSERILRNVKYSNQKTGDIKKNTYNSSVIRRFFLMNTLRMTLIQMG